MWFLFALIITLILVEILFIYKVHPNNSNNYNNI